MAVLFGPRRALNGRKRRSPPPSRRADSDPTLFVVSAWNDNGLRGKVADKANIYRSGFFPGLGWLLSRRLWEEELQPKWPHEHWDHWMRDNAQRRNRDSVFPEVPRDYHAGRKGTFMDEYHHNRYFKVRGG